MMLISCHRRCTVQTERQTFLKHSNNQHKNQNKMSKERKQIAVIIGKEKVNSSDIIAMREIVAPLFGKWLYKVESTKLDEEETGPNAARLYSIKDVLVKNAEYLSAEETRNNVATIMLNGDATLTFPVVENPFKTIDPAESIRKDYEIGEGWYMDGIALAKIVKSMNEGTIATYNAKINKLTALCEVVEQAILVDETAQEQRNNLEAIINS